MLALFLAALGIVGQPSAGVHPPVVAPGTRVRITGVASFRPAGAPVRLAPAVRGSEVGEPAFYATPGGIVAVPRRGHPIVGEVVRLSEGGLQLRIDGRLQAVTVPKEAIQTVAVSRGRAPRRVGRQTLRGC